MPNTSKKIDKSKRPIGVFDSGVGGLSVLIELKKLLPHEDFVFLADQFYVPYGEKSRQELVDLTTKITEYFVEKHNVKMMVVACNTATCGAIGDLRAKFTFPIIGTVPAIKPAAEKTRTKEIAVISTPSTSKSSTLKRLIHDNCRGIKVWNIGCKNLEDTVEKGDLNSEDVKKLLNKFLGDIQGTKVDHLVLGCTHYPFLKHAIGQILGPKVKLIDGGLAIAKQTSNLLANYFLENNREKQGKTLYFTTGDSSKFTKVASKLLKHPIRSKNVKL